MRSIKWESLVHLALVLALAAAPTAGQQESSTVPAATESSVKASVAPSSELSSTTPSPSAGVSQSSTSSEAPTTLLSVMTASATTTEGGSTTARNTSGRAFDFEASDTNETTVEKGSLQDLSLDDIDMNVFMTPDSVNDTMEETSMPPSSTGASAAPATLCVEPKGTFGVGERWTRGCDENCTCDAGGRSVCEPRCSLPLIRRGSRALDAECYERPSQDPCCAVMVCTHDQDTETEPVEECQFKNQTLQRGESAKDGCESVCTCGEAGSVVCKPRCAPVSNTTSDRCVAVQDTVDPCCTVVRCDVTLTDHEVAEPVSEDTAGTVSRVKLTSVVAVNTTAARVETEGPLPAGAMLETSADGSQWIAAPRSQGPVLAGLPEGTTVWVRAVVANMPSNALQVTLPMDESIVPSKDGGCFYKGSNHSVGEEFRDGCEATCKCTASGVQCTDFVCPSHMMMLLEPHCVQWETDPPAFEAGPGRCCPDAVRCVHNGSCAYLGERFEHRASVPQRLTGCEKRCVCDAGNVTCVDACPPTPHAPPADLPCAPHRAALDHVPGDGCCLHWTCPPPHALTHGDASAGLNATYLTSPGPSPTADEGQTLPGPFVLHRDPNRPSSTTTPGPTTTTSTPAPTTASSPQTTTSIPSTTPVTFTTSTDVTSLPGPVVVLAPKPSKPDKTKGMDTKPASPSPSGKPFSSIEGKKNTSVDVKSHKPTKDHIPVHEDVSYHQVDEDDTDERPFDVRPPFLPVPHPEKPKATHETPPFLGPNAVPPPQRPDRPHRPELPEHVLHELQHQGLFPGQAQPPPPPGPPVRRPQRPPTPQEEQEIFLHHLLPPQIRPTVPQGQSPSPDEEEQLIHHLQQQGLLPPGKIAPRPGGRPAPPPQQDQQDLLHHLQQQGILPPQQHPKNVEAGQPDEQEILYHLQQRGLIPPGAGGPPPRAPPQRPPAQGHDHDRDLYLHFQQQGLIPSHPHEKPQKHPQRPAPDHEQEILLHLQQQGLIPTKSGPRSSHPNENNDHEILAHLPPPPPPGKTSKLPPKTSSDDEEDVFAHFQQGLLPFQQAGGGAGRPAGRAPPPPPRQPPRHPPRTESELIYQLQQQGLLPPGAAAPGGGVHPPLLLPPPPPSSHHFQLPTGGNQSHADYSVTSVPGGFQHLPVSAQPEEVMVQTLEPLDPTSVRVVFSVPPVFVGLHGRIELRYTDDKNNHDPSTWKPQVLAPPQDLLATPTLEFTLGDLKPDTEYQVKITVLLRDLQNSPSSPILTVRTPPVPTSTLPPVVPVSPELEAAEVNASWAVLTWRRFSDFEMQLIDGVQLRYKPLEDKVYQATPLIHRAVTSYTIENLKPSTTYEVRIFFIPFPGQASELQSDSAFQFTTKEPEDMYKFDVHMEIHHIKSTTIEVNWTGVPYPEDKYVNIYRAIYQSDSGKEDFSTFSVAKRDSTHALLIKDLAPGTRYRLWLEVYLTNGKIKKSNVQDFNTRPGSVDPVGSSHQGKLESSAAPVREAGDYYSPLVAVAILAALAIMATLILLLMLMKRRSQSKAITANNRKSQSAYDNPSYKTCEEQQPAANGNGSVGPAPASAAATAAPAATKATAAATSPAAVPAPAPQPA